MEFTGTLIAQAGLNATDKKDFLSRIYLIDDVDIAVVFGGTNDYFWSDRGIGGETPQFFTGAVKRILEHVRQTRCEKHTLFVTPYMHIGEGNFCGGKDWKDANRHDTTEKNYNGHILLDYVNEIKRLCGEYDVPSLDLHHNFDFDWRKHTLDGCHPNEMGHKIIAAHIEDAIRTALIS